MDATRATTAESAALMGARQLLSDYVALTKPKVQSLLLFTTVSAMFIAGTPSAWLVVATVIGGYLSAGGSGAINHWYDRDIDALMRRTATRPLPAGVLPPASALALGFALAASSWLVLTSTANTLAGRPACCRGWWRPRWRSTCRPCSAAW